MISDKFIQRNIHDKLKGDSRVNAENITILVKNGKVKLNGSVRNLLEKKYLEEDVKSIEGVLKIEETIEIDRNAKVKIPFDKNNIQVILGGRNVLLGGNIEDKDLDSSLFDTAKPINNFYPQSRSNGLNMPTFNSVDKIDENALLFNIQVKNKIEDIIKPLMGIIPITNFSYLRFYKDGRLLHIQPNQPLLEHLLDNNFNNQGLKNEKLRESVRTTVVSSQYLWPNHAPDDLSLFLLQFGLKNTTSFVTKNKNYIDSLTVSNDLDDKLGQDLNEDFHKIYKHFYAYFIEKINEIIDFSDKDIYFQSTLYNYYNGDDPGV